MFRKVLIANRGEIALRVIRACKELGIETVTVHSTADANSLHVRFSDQSVCIGPPVARDSYLNVPNLLSAIEISGADAVHPGYGFLSENAEFADTLERIGITFIGPTGDQIRTMGDKATAKSTVRKAGMPLVPGSLGLLATVDEAREVANEIGYPVLLKASAGGGGKGMKIAQTEADLAGAFQLAGAEAMACFGNGALYMEKLVQRPRHIEVQVLGDKHGNVVHLGERECSLQRRHQKVLEEAPSPLVTPEMRAAMGEAAVNAAKAIGYNTAGTVEFLADEDRNFYFIEMNTRIQVEHPVTEMITGVDLVKQMIKSAAGEPLPFKQEDIEFRGHAIECRINAEDPTTFAPSPGTITGYHEPGGLGVRVDSWVHDRAKVLPYYDSMLAKLIVWGEDRDAAVLRMRWALDEYVVEGIKTTVPFHRRVLRDPTFLAGDLDTGFIDRFLAEPEPDSTT
ncbi:MAG: acetyl-CoA carboxylase biotin carboxylase subunit [Deltaproteobacteria bacterium]|nr:acetyl-CoA carboxylase biotin carboxylase subunit [Deltaproteobacteria bacterium]